MMREIFQDHTADAFRAMKALRKHLGDRAQFVKRVDAQRSDGYRLLGAYDDDADQGSDVLAVLGFRVGTNLAWGRFCYVDDLSTLPEARGRGYAADLLDEVARIATEAGCQELHLDSGVQAERESAHRLYLGKRMRIASYHFQRTL